MHTLDFSGCGRSASTAIAVIALASSTLHACPPEYEYEMACAPPCGTIKSGARGLDINEAGDIVGFTTGFCYQEKAFIWKAGTPNLQFLPMPPGTTSSRADAINDSGQIVGVFVNPANPEGSGGFIIDNGVFTDMGTLPGGNWSEAYDINDAGVAVGWWGNTVVGPSPMAMTWTNGAMQDLSLLLPLVRSRAFAINDRGCIAGVIIDQGAEIDGRAFVWDGKRAQILPPTPGGHTSSAQAINNIGQMTGWGNVPCSPPSEFCNIRKGFLWDGKRMIALGSLPGYPNVRPYDLNDAGQIVGYMEDLNNQKAFLWEGGQIHVIDDLVPGFDGINIGSGTARGINSAGQIAGSATIAAGTCALRLTPKPQRIADLDCDAAVSAADLAILIRDWGVRASVADLDSNGQVDARDLDILLGDWDG